MQEPGPHTSSSNFALWNPNAAANWSLLFTPAFGAYLHAQNWRAMGEQDRASASMRWLFVGLALLAVYFLVGIFGEEEKTGDSIDRIVASVYLLSWYFGSAKAQAKHVKEKYGASYPRKGWGKPLLVAVGCFVGFFALTVLVGVVVGIAGGT